MTEYVSVSLFLTGEVRTLTKRETTRLAFIAYWVPQLIRLREKQWHIIFST